MDSLLRSHPEVFEGFQHDNNGASALDATLLKDSVDPLVPSTIVRIRSGPEGNQVTERVFECHST